MTTVYSTDEPWDFKKFPTSTDIFPGEVNLLSHGEKSND